jgi:hypothetical protein
VKKSNIFQRFKHYLRSAFREIIVYHNSSLEFRAKLFAIVSGVDKKISAQEEEIIKASALKIYENDENRATTLWLATKEYVEKIHKNNDLGIDELARDIEKLIKRNHRFVHKINTNDLMPIVEAQMDRDTKDYQLHIIEFLESLKREYTL